MTTSIAPEAFRVSRWTTEYGFEIPAGITPVPPAVQKANSVVRAARLACVEATAARRRARAELKHAPALDRERDRAQFDLGNQPTPEAERSVTLAQHELERAERVSASATSALQDAQRALAVEVSEAIPTWLPEQERRSAATRERLEALLREACTVVQQISQDKVLEDELRRFPVSRGSLSGIDFQVPAPPNVEHAEERLRTANDGGEVSRRNLYGLLVAAIAATRHL